MLGGKVGREGKGREGKVEREGEVRQGRRKGWCRGGTKEGKGEGRSGRTQVADIFPPPPSHRWSVIASLSLSLSFSLSLCCRYSFTLPFRCTPGLKTPRIREGAETGHLAKSEVPLGRCLTRLKTTETEINIPHCFPAPPSSLSLPLGPSGKTW